MASIGSTCHARQLARLPQAAVSSTCCLTASKPQLQAPAGQNGALRLPRGQQGLCRCTSQLSVTPSGKERPDYTGSGVLSSLVNLVIATPPLFAVLKHFAREHMKKAAAKGGISWDGLVQELQSAELESIRAELEDPSVRYPAYFLREFHGYPEGNLGWLAAQELEPATLSLFLMVYKTETLSPQEAQDRGRGEFVDAIKEYTMQYSSAPVSDILDVACSCGISTRYLADGWPAAQAVGLDLSPYFVSVAELREREAASQPATRRRIQYQHGNWECSGLPDASLDLISAQYLVHELPADVTRKCLVESRRLLRPGGVLAMVDTNPQSEVLLSLPKPIAMLMKSTEPWMDEYFTLDMRQALKDAGFQNIVFKAINPRHRVMLATA